MLYSPRMQGNAYPFRPTSDEFQSDALCDGQFLTDNAQFHPSKRSHSRGSRPRVADGFVQSSDISNPRSFSVPKRVYGYRRGDDMPAMQDSVLATDPDSGNNQIAGQVMGRYLPKALVRANGLGRTRSLCKSEVDAMNAAENSRITRTSSSKSSARHGSIGGKTPVVMTLQRPNLGKLFACEESPSVSRSVACTAVEFHHLHAEVGIASTKFPQLIENYHLPASTDVPDSVVVCTSAAYRHTDGLEVTHSGFSLKDSYGNSLKFADPKTMFTSNTSTDEECVREPSSFSSPMPMNDERWAGPAYSNSPPPSSLPFPKFSIQQLRTSSLEIPLSDFEPSEEAVGSGSQSAPATPSRSLCCDSSLTAEFLGLGLDVANATKDLRRILNLDAKT